jgi:hypothetical protein
MKPPKTLQKYAADHGLQIVRIRYRFQGIPQRRPGYDLIKPDGEIVAQFEPIPKAYDGAAWIIKHAGNLRYPKRITAADLQQIDPNRRSYLTLRQPFKPWKP